eukprot:jgi/Hompol1/2046/HPOL_002847-RA
MAEEQPQQQPQENPQPAGEQHAMDRPLATRLWEITETYVPLALTSFGGPQAHVAMFITEFVEKRKWLPAHVFTELFAIAQSLPGPASTQLGYSIALVRGGVSAGLLSFTIWSLPCMLIMAGFGIGVSNIGSSLPAWVRYLQNGLTSAAVGLVALAAFKLSSKLLADPISAFLGATSAILAINLYQYAWLFPVLMIFGGTFSFSHSLYLAYQERRARDAVVQSEESRTLDVDESKSTPSAQPASEKAADPVLRVGFSYSAKAGLILLTIWLILLIVSILLRAVTDIKPLSLLGTMYFVGSIIFGGGPVVIPLMQNYVTTNGWMTDSEFLIGVALINALPGPNFNIAAYAGSLVLRGSAASSLAGALLGNIGIFLPGLLLMSGLLPLWSQYRSLKWVQAVFKGVNAAAAGLVFAATYLLARKAIVPPDSATLGIADSIANYPLYLGIAGASYTASGFLGLPTPIAVILGGVCGVIDWLVHRMP